MKIVACLAFAALLQTNGCDSPQQSGKQEPAKPERPPIHRFENVSMPGSPGVALDTVTGQLCRTWDWVYKAATNPNKGGLDDLPTCLSIYRETPATGDSRDPFGQFGGKAQ